MAATVYGVPDPEVQDILVVDTSDGSEARISGVDSLGENLNILFPKISSDGSRVVAPVNAPPSGTRRVWWWDRDGTEFVGPFPVPAPTPNHPADIPSISDDGNRIAFWTRDANTDGMVVVYDVDTDTSTLITLSSIGLTASGHIFPTPFVSGDGNTVVFTARADVFQPPRLVYAYNLIDDSFTVVSVDETGQPSSEEGSLSQQQSPV